MKKLLTLLFSIIILPISVYASDVYYCSDDGLVGFDPADNFKIGTYNERKFKIMIDFENENVVSESLYLGSTWDQKCWYTDIHDTLYCMNEVGLAFSINKNTLSYFNSKIYNSTEFTDTAFIGHGTCEKF
jgi:hypothetical protein